MSLGCGNANPLLCRHAAQNPRTRLRLSMVYYHTNVGRVFGGGLCSEFCLAVLFVSSVFVDAVPRSALESLGCNGNKNPMASERYGLPNAALHVQGYR